ncbi:hypothetical protein MMC17_009007 [Xylographa soralifera]|nr:hypothetical protein [Xylographa soralifera]
MAARRPPAYILLLGVTGAGKSTLIQKATSVEDIVIGEDMDSCTTDVAEYVAMFEDQDVYLIDTPGFDDGTRSDIEVLKNIASYVNGIYAEGKRLSGVLYLHDITLERMRGSGFQNLEMLPRLVGQDKLGFITLVTTHWGHLRDANQEERNETQLATNDRYWKPLLAGQPPAQMHRFLNTADSAWEIIRTHLNHQFVPAVTEQTVIEGLSLGRSDAGITVQRNVDQHLAQQLETAEAQGIQARGEIAAAKEEARKALAEKANAGRDAKYVQACRALREKREKNRFVRWTLRVGALAGSVLATVMTGDAAGVALLFIPATESWAQSNAKKGQKQQELLDTKYHDEKMASKQA